MIVPKDLDLTAQELRTLADFLKKRSTFSLFELKGFFTALVSSERLVSPREWLVSITGTSQLFSSEKETRENFFLLSSLYNQMLRDLSNDVYSPLVLYEESMPKDPQKLKEESLIWLKGFRAGIDLAGAETSFFRGHRISRKLLHDIAKLQSHIEEREGVSPEDIATLGCCVKQFYDYWINDRKEARRREFPMHDYGYLGRILGDLNNEERLPVDAILELIKHKSESIPLLLELVAYRLEDYKRRAEDYDDFVFSLYILAFLRERRAFPHIIKIARLPSSWIEKLLGDHMTEGLSSLIVSTYDGNFSALKNVIENVTLNIYARTSTLQSLLGLVATEQLSREDVIDYLKYLIHSSVIHDYELATVVMEVAVRLYPQELYNDLLTLFDRDLIETGFRDIRSPADIDKALLMGKDDCIDKLYSDKYILPVINVVNRLAWCGYPDQEQIFESMPFIRTLPKIQRNDPCMCGSGKKYKKCCLNVGAYA